MAFGKMTQIPWFISMVVACIIAYFAAYRLSYYFIKHEIIYLIPISFALIPMIGVFIAYKGKLLKKQCNLRIITLTIIAISLLIWIGVAYVYLENIFPSVF
jgi:hypothetical protein